MTEFTLDGIRPQIHFWSWFAPADGPFGQWTFRCLVDDAAEYVTGWLFFKVDGQDVELREDIPYSTILKLAKQFGSPLVVLDHWMIAMCEKAALSTPLFPERVRVL